jgi:cytoskeletal protein CcmA (bactofilin family)
MKQKPFWSGLVRVGLLVLLLVLSTSAAYAFTNLEGENVTIEKDEVIKDDLYVAAETFVLEGTVDGDLYVMGKTITINGIVEGDIVAAGQRVAINGIARDDVRIAGAALTVGPDANIADDLVAAGYSLENRSGSTVQGNVVFMGKQSILAGTVNGDVLMAGGGLSLQGEILGNVQAEVGAVGDEPRFDVATFFPDMPAVPAVPFGLTMGSGARVDGDLSYSSPRKGEIGADQVEGDVSYQRESLDETKWFGREESVVGKVFGWFLHHLRRLAVLFLLGWLILWRTPNWLNRTSSQLQEKPWHSLGWGTALLLGFVAALIAGGVVVLLISIVLGGPFFLLGLTVIIPALLIFLVVALYLTKIVVGFVGGRLLLERTRPELADKPIWSLLAGLAVIVILTALPFIGGIINLLISLFGLGTLWLVGREMMRGDTPQPEPAPETEAG